MTIDERVEQAIKRIRQRQERPLDFENDDLVTLLRDLLAAETEEKERGE